MAKASALEQRNVPTTNFAINLNKIDVNALQEKYQLFTIEVPNFRFLKDQNKFSKLHNAYKEQLDLPYYFYSFAEPNATIFILADKSKQLNQSISLVLDFLKDEQIIAQEKAISELCTQKNIHILAKLFLSDYFYNYKKTYRICQGKFYIHSRDNNKWATVLEIKGLNHIKNTNEFCFDQKATFMVKVEEENSNYLNSNVYCELVENEIYYRQLKTSHVRKLLADTENSKTIWKVVTGSQTNKPSIKWFEAYDEITRCKSTLLQEFQAKLLKHYNKCFGIDVAMQQEHKMTKLKPLTQTAIQGYGKETGLNINLLGKIGLLDLRFKDVKEHNTIPFSPLTKDFENRQKKAIIKF